jgi:hypothetical protein
LHVGTEDAPCYLNTVGGDGIFKAFDQGLSYGGRSGVSEAGTTTPARVGVERELRDDEGCAVDVQEGAVHLAFVVAEDAQVNDFVYQGFDLGLAIVLSHTEEDEQPLINLSGDALVDGNAGVRDALK